jgi:L-threonylcarbamoyladenylate synthase
MSLISSEQAVQRLAAGQPVALPTETVYGLAADATLPEAVASVFRLKGRPSDHPLIVHVDRPERVAQWLDWTAQAEHLARAFWPGPLTLVLPHRGQVSSLITGGQSSLAVRMPRHPLFLEILARLGHPLVAPSANRFGQVSPTTAQHVLDEFGGEVAVVDGGPCQVGLESTIYDVAGQKILRPGHISQAAIEAVIGPLQGSAQPSPRVPGSLASHYAPRTPAFWWTGQSRRGRWGWLGFSEAAQAQAVERLSPDPVQAAQQLYAALRRLDRLGLDCIWVEPLPTGLDWLAVADRLSRALTFQEEDPA